MSGVFLFPPQNKRDSISYPLAQFWLEIKSCRIFCRMSHPSANGFPLKRISVIAVTDFKLRCEVDCLRQLVWQQGSRKVDVGLCGTSQYQKVLPNIWRIVLLFDNGNRLSEYWQVYNCMQIYRQLSDWAEEDLELCKRQSTEEGWMPKWIDSPWNGIMSPFEGNDLPLRTTILIGWWWKPLKGSGKESLLGCYYYNCIITFFGSWWN